MTSPCCVSELEQIVDGADHRPLGSDLVEAAQEELVEASGVFDLAEHRFDDLLSQAVAATPAGALAVCRHGRLARASRPTSRSGGMRLAVALCSLAWDGPVRPSPGRGGFLASASSVALAARMRSSRAVLLATQSGISSPRRSEPWVRSSSASVASARANQADTSAVSLFSVSSMRP